MLVKWTPHPFACLKAHENPGNPTEEDEQDGADLGSTHEHEGGPGKNKGSYIKDGGGHNIQACGNDQDHYRNLDACHSPSGKHVILIAI